MSTLSSRTTHLRNYIFEGVPLPGALLVEDGLDVELLARFVTQLRPSMDYLRGYRPLDSWFTQTVHIPYGTWLEEADLAGRYAQCIYLLCAGMQRGTGDNWLPLTAPEQERYPRENKRFAELRAFLTRKGEWVVWANYPESKFCIVESVEDAMDAIKDLTPAGIRLCDGRGLLQSPALRMLTELRNLVRESIEQKRRDILRDEKLVDGLNANLKRFQMI